MTEKAATTACSLVSPRGTTLVLVHRYVPGLGLGFVLIWDFFFLALIRPIPFSNLLPLPCFRFQKPCCTQTTPAMMM
jgi:hypothetical protein